MSRDDSIVVALPSNILPENKTTGLSQIIHCHGDGAVSTLKHKLIHPSFSITTYPALRLAGALEPFPDVFKAIKARICSFEHDGGKQFGKTNKPTD